MNEDTCCEAEDRKDMPSIASGNIPDREKYWEELANDEKVEKLARTLEAITEQRDRLASIVDSIFSMLKNHKHLDGKIVVDAPKEYHQLDINKINSGRWLLNRKPK